MVTKKPKGLGRGLEALLGPKVDDVAIAAANAQQGEPSTLPLAQLVPGMYQPRTRMDEGALQELANSCKAPSSMRVRGWYMPGTSCANGNVLGSPCCALAAAIATSSTLGPSSASSPRPNPLGFLVTIFFFSRCFLLLHFSCCLLCAYKV